LQSPQKPNPTRSLISWIYVYNANQVVAKNGVSHKTKVQLELTQAVKSGQ
jgi:hypothetical protein